MSNKDKNEALSGEKNQRLGSKMPICNSVTEARSDVNKTVDISNVPIPSKANVDNAKEWVDNGSRL